MKRCPCFQNREIASDPAVAMVGCRWSDRHIKDIGAVSGGIKEEGQNGMEKR